MIVRHFISIFSIGSLMFFLSCTSPNSKLDTTDQVLHSRFIKLIEYPLDSLAFPRSASLNPEKIHKVPSKDWTSGFFPGNLWMIYNLTNKNKYKDAAIKWTAFVEKEKYNNATHDMGFKVFCSYGNGYKTIKSSHYKEVIIKSAQTLSTRFNKAVGCIRSWDFNKKVWGFPVIIDNMMNLELLFEATKISGDSLYHKIAISHANTTLKNHFRENGSSNHVIDYNPSNGKVRMKVTHQGYADSSSWARGQAWAIYGYTMAYRYTQDEKYLRQAEKTANFYLSHKNLPKDGIPFWDFDAPLIPNEPKDVSAATVISSAFVELYQYTKNSKYLSYSNKVVKILKSNKYLLTPQINVPFILNHSTGNWPKNDEIDEPIVYADYYFLETLLRLKEI